MPSLQTHMIRVAAVAELILSGKADSSSKIHKEDLIAALLLHDLGNIVKFDLERELAVWKKIQQETIAQYGSDDHEATEKMGQELGINDRVALLLSGMGFGNVHQAIDANDMELKICLYADQRVSPDGVVSIRERFSDLRKRYRGTPLEKRYDALQEEKALVLEQEIFKGSSLHPSEINDQSITPYLIDFE